MNTASAEFYDYWYNLHVVDISGKIVGTSVQSKRRQVSEGINMFDYHPDSHKCMQRLRTACRNGEDILCRYVSDDDVNYIAVIEPINRFKARVHEFRAASFEEKAVLELIDDYMGSSYSVPE